MYLGHHYGKNKPNENKPHKSNQHKEYQDEQQLYQLRQGDTAELRELKNKVKVLVGKLANGKKQRDQLQKNNENLQKEILELQNNLRHMVTGFSNTSSSFPMPNQLAAKISEFYKCDCLDTYFDVLAPQQLTLKGVIYFYMQLFASANRMVDDHFQGAYSGLKAIGCLQSLEGPILNVLRKAFQPKHKEILSLIAKEDKIARRVQQLVDELGLGSSDRQETIQLVSTFFVKLIEIMLESKICDPPLVIDVSSMGKRVQFTGLYHDPFDGFIKAKEECFVILPEVRKQEQHELIVKGLVLHKNYDPTN